MVRTLIVFLLLAQSVVIAGPVCGNHATTMESMDCCKKGHNDDSDGFSDPHASACCSTCDMGKGQGVKQQLTHLFASMPQTPTIEMIAAEPAESFWVFQSEQQYSSFSPPDIFLLDRSFRI